MDPTIGEIRCFAGNFAPRGWHLCDGASMPISQWDALFALIGTTYGGDGQMTFNLPDLRGRRAVHAGNAPGFPSYWLGEMAGTESITISNAQMPTHQHTMTADISLSTKWQCVNGPAVAGTSPAGNYFAIATENVYATTVDGTMGAPVESTNFGTLGLAAAGGSQPIDIRTPYTAINYIICLEGIFPSRN